MGSAEKKAKLDKKDAAKPEEKAEDEEIQILGGNSKKQPPKLKQSKLKMEPKKKAKKSARPMKEKPKHEEGKFKMAFNLFKNLYFQFMNFRFGRFRASSSQEEEGCQKSKG